MTVERSVKSLLKYPVHFLTVHCAGGEVMLKAAVKGAGNSGLQILGVTVLTSLGPDDHREELGYRKGLTLKDLAVTRAEMAEKAGCAGVICSGLEVGSIRQNFPNLKTVVPGIRQIENDLGGNDQKRVITPKQAIQSGADYLVVGRPIRNAADPKAAAQHIVQEISEALSGAK
jgi:orotidine-5'-phosphate decarboxylase